LAISYIYSQTNIIRINIQNLNDILKVESKINFKDLLSLTVDEKYIWLGSKTGFIYQLPTNLNENPSIFYEVQKGNIGGMYPVNGIQKNNFYLVANICKGNKIMVWNLTNIYQVRVINCTACVKIRLYGDYLICGAGSFISVYNLKNTDLTLPMFIGGAHLKPIVNLAVSSNIIASTDKYGCIFATEVIFY